MATSAMLAMTWIRDHTVGSELSRFAVRQVAHALVTLVVFVAAAFFLTNLLIPYDHATQSRLSGWY